MITAIEKKLDAVQPLDRREALFLLSDVDLLTLGKLADGIRRRMHPQRCVS
jgi:cyclic dehypoxanthinyl futalosine synthase